MHQASPQRLQITETDLDACRTLLRSGSKSFFAASFLLPDRIRAPASALYAFCRVADDAIDVAGGNAEAIAELHARISAAYAGHPRNTPYDRAFAATIADYAIPSAVPEALIEGFSWDVAQRRYETLEDLLGYAARVAGTVGVMMCLLMGRRDTETLARATDLGMAMQLTNIARDVGEDARAGRLYLPLVWCREAGVDPDVWMRDPTFSPDIASVIARLLAAADELYMRADHGIAALPADCRRGIRAARHLYAEIGDQVRRIQLNSIDTRAVVSGSRKISVLGHALVAAGPKVTGARFGTTDSSRFLIAAVAAMPGGAVPLAQDNVLPFRWWDLRTQAIHTIDLLEGLERRKRQSSPNKRPVFNTYASDAHRI